MVMRGKQVSPGTLCPNSLEDVECGGRCSGRNGDHCQTLPPTLSPLCVLEAPLSALLDSPSVCLVLNWEEPCNNGSEILAYNIDLGDSCITVGNTTTHVMKNLLPETTYR